MGSCCKICTNCGRSLPYSAFNKDKSRADGHRNRCRECDAAYFQSKSTDPEWKEARNQQSRSRRAALKNEDPEQLWVFDAVSNARQRARRGSVLFDIDFDYVRSLVVNTCPLLGLPLLYTQSKLSDNSPTLDRKNPALGYTRGNLAVISHRANRIKNDATVEELQLLLNNLINYLQSD